MPCSELLRRRYRSTCPVQTVPSSNEQINMYEGGVGPISGKWGVPPGWGLARAAAITVPISQTWPSDAPTTRGIGMVGRRSMRRLNAAGGLRTYGTLRRYHFHWGWRWVLGGGAESQHASWLNALHRLAEPEIQMKAMVGSGLIARTGRLRRERRLTGRRSGTCRSVSQHASSL